MNGQLSQVFRLSEPSGHFSPRIAKLVSTLLVFTVLACSPNEDLAVPDEPTRSTTLPANQLTEVQLAEIEALQALGYVVGDVPAPVESGVTRYDKTRTWEGYNLYSSEHAPRIFLLDMEGKLLHMWEVTLPEINDALLPRRFHLYPNGEILILIEGRGLVRLDRDSRVLWSRLCPCHHDFAVAEDGSIYVLTRRTAVYPAYQPSEPIRNDFITVLDANGRMVREVSMLAAFESSRCCRGYLQRGMHGDVFHSNTLELLDGRLADRHPAFRAGNILTSWRALDAIGVVDMTSEVVVWSADGYFRAQHHPTVLDSGNILLFDNEDTSKPFDASRIIEVEPLSGDIQWSFESTEEFPFYSRTGGAIERLPNGNTLITETRGGRAIEVAPDGDVVWLYVNPARVVNQQDKIARIYELMRIPADMPMGWLQSRVHPPDALTLGFRERNREKKDAGKGRH